MPRIPTRTTPYDTPNRQHRHFKNKRDQILKALGKSSYINGSQFAIVWVSARGETETYASPVLRTLLNPQAGQFGLFGEDVLDRIKLASKQAKYDLKSSTLSNTLLAGNNQSEIIGKKRKSPLPDSRHDQTPIPTVTASYDLQQALESVEDDFKENLPLPVTGSHSYAEGLSSFQDVKMIESPLLSSSSSSACSPSPTAIKFPSSNESEGAMYNGVKEPHPEENFKTASRIVDMSNFAGGSDLSLTAPNPSTSSNSPYSDQQLKSVLGHVDRSQKVLDSPITLPCDENAQVGFKTTQKMTQPNLRVPSRIFKPLPIRPGNQSSTWNEVCFNSHQSISQFLQGKFGQLQQAICKLVCKAWIKVIEPKKQTKFPYRGGDIRKPDWWPADIRHKEPDHLAKPERLRLMLAILGSGRVEVARLELASAEQAAYITQDKMAILRDIYAVAKEEERLRDTWAVNGTFAPFKVKLSNTPIETEPHCTASESSYEFAKGPAESFMGALPDNGGSRIHPLGSDSLSPLPESTHVKSGNLTAPNSQYETQYTRPLNSDERKPQGLNFDSGYFPPNDLATSMNQISRSESRQPLSDMLPSNPIPAQSNPTANMLSNGVESYLSHLPSYISASFTADNHAFPDRQRYLRNSDMIRTNSLVEVSDMNQRTMSFNGDAYTMGLPQQWGHLGPVLSSEGLHYSPLTAENRGLFSTESAHAMQPRASPMHDDTNVFTSQVHQKEKHPGTGDYRQGLSTSSNGYNATCSMIPLPLSADLYHSTNSDISQTETTGRLRSKFSTDIDPWAMSDGNCYSNLDSAYDNSRSYSVLNDNLNLSRSTSSACSLEPVLGSLKKNNDANYSESESHAYRTQSQAKMQATSSDVALPECTSNLSAQILHSTDSQLKGPQHFGN